MTTGTEIKEPMGMNPRYWWVQILLGIALMAISIWFYWTPVATYVSLALFFSYAMFVSGIFEIINAIEVRKDFKGWGLLLLGGLIDLVLGVYLISHESITLQVLPILLGLWFLFRALAFFVVFGQLKREAVKNSGWLLGAAVLTLVFGIAVLAKPIIGELTLVYSVSLALFFMGLFRLTLGIQQRGFVKKHDHKKLHDKH